MIHCDAMLDRMPDVAAGRSAWSEEESGHLRDCAECQSHWKVVRAGVFLGQGLVAEVVPEAIAGRVRDRLRAERRRTLVRRIGWLTGLAAAASLALVLWSGRGPNTPTAPVAELTIPVAELDSLSAPELQSVYEAMEAPLVEGSSAEAVPMGELDDQQLERILRALEG